MHTCLCLNLTGIYTDSTGRVTFTFTPQHVGILQVTMTGHNYLPYEGTVSVQPVGIEERATLNASRKTLEIYPNPAKTYFTVRLPQTANSSQIRMFDVSGKLVRIIKLNKSKSLIESGVRISLKGINPGFYFLQFGTVESTLHPNRVQEVKKFLVVK